MALPAGIVTTQITFGTAVAMISAKNLSMSVTFTPTTSLVWAATGTVLIADAEGFTADPGAQGSVTLINPDQAGFADGNGNTIRNFGYKVEATYSDGKTVLFTAPPKYITWTAADSGPLDLDQMIPVTASSGITVSMPLVTSVNGSTGDVVVSGDSGSSTAVLAPRPAAAFAGDSITNGSSASAGQRFVDILPLLVGHTTIYPIPALAETSTLRTSAVYGVPGERSDQVLARIPAILATNPGILVVLAGTNDASQLVPVATFAANIDQIVRAARVAGVPVIIGTVPPRSASTAANIRALIPAYNVWLTDYCSRKGIPCARINGALADSTGNLAAAYDSGDGTHPNNAGHLAIAKAYAAAYRSMYTTAPPVVTAFGLGYNGNPLMNGATDASGYFEMPGGTGTAPTYSVKPADGILTAGQWEEMDFDATASGGQRIYAAGPSTPNLATGDKLLLCANVEIIDVTGGLVAAMSAGTGGATVRLMDSNANPLTGDTISFAGTLTPGTIARLYTVPAGVTGLLLFYICTLPTGQHAKFRIGQWDVINLTKLGLDTLAI